MKRIQVGPRTRGTQTRARLREKNPRADEQKADVATNDVKARRTVAFRLIKFTYGLCLSSRGWLSNELNYASNHHMLETRPHSKIPPPPKTPTYIFKELILQIYCAFLWHKSNKRLVKLRPIKLLVIVSTQFSRINGL